MSTTAQNDGRPLMLNESDLESGEEVDDKDEDSPIIPQAAQGSTANTVLEKRSRGKLWISASLDSELADQLTKVSTNDAGKKKFVDLDAPAASVEELANRGEAYQQKVSQNASIKGVRKEQLQSTKNVIGGKRKNVMMPRPKRRQTKEKVAAGGKEEKKFFFSVYPDLNSEITHDDPVEVAIRKALHQLNEKFNPDTIGRIVSHIGNAETRRLLQMTKTIEQHGGMLTKDNSTRRSAGGVFITLFKSDAEKQMGVDGVKAFLRSTDVKNPAKVAARKARAKARRAERQKAQGKGGPEIPKKNDGTNEAVAVDEKPVLDSAMDESVVLANEVSKEQGASDNHGGDLQMDVVTQ